MIESMMVVTPTQQRVAARTVTAERLMVKAVAESRRQGHKPTIPSPDMAGFAQVAYCTQCGRYICVDLDESSEPYGSGYTERCDRNRRGKRA